MKSRLSLALSGLMLLNAAQAVTTLNKGVTIGDWLSTDEATYIQTTRYTKADFEDIQSLGCDHVRILVNFNTSYNAPPGYDLSPIFYNRLDKALDWAQETGLKVIIAAQGFNIASSSWEFISQQLAFNWKNVAARYAARGDVVVYEILAYPDTMITQDLWHNAAGVIVAAIRQVDTQHTIIYGPVRYSVDQMFSMTKLSDDNILYAFEFFDPATFTRQGTEYLGVTYNSAVIPFPYDAAGMPAMDALDAGTDAETAFANYPLFGAVAYVNSRLNQAISFAVNNSVPVYCASFGVQVGTQWSSQGESWDVPSADRGAWLEAVRTHLEGHNTGWCLAGYRNNFGIFHDYSLGSEEWLRYCNFKYDVNGTVAAALGLTAPAPADLEPIEVKGDLVLYDDEVTPLARVNLALGETAYQDLYVTDNPAVGQCCMGIFYPEWYGFIEFLFPVYLDMQWIVDQGYVLDFFIRCENPAGHLQVRFIDTNMDFEDKPWRMNFHVDDSVVPFDGEWQRVTVPLAELSDMGAWETDTHTWTSGPGGLFDWSSVQTFHFVSENEAQPESEIFIDRVRIVSPTAVDEDKAEKPDAFRLEANFPNPFNASTTIGFNLPVRSHAKLAVFNTGGQSVRTLVSGDLNAGEYRYSWDGLDDNRMPVPSGVYFYECTADKQKISRKMVLIR
jgi:hypothetical protein